jgi:hypothetical protein
MPTLPPARAWQPVEDELFPNAKRIAARLAESVTTYGAGSSRATVARAAERRLDFRQGDLGRIITPLVDPAARSVGEVIYPQMAGTTTTSAGVMVLVRQRRLAGGRITSATRVLDVRLARTPGGPWRVDRLAGAGGTAPARAVKLSPAARRALRHPNLAFSDSARWDIQRGGIDDALLTALADAAGERPLSVIVLRTGHPRLVWGTGRASAHSVGRAADIHAVSGRLVIRQRETTSPAYRVAARFAAGGAAQLGSPWVFGPNSFTDSTHADHLHLQWSSVR